MAGTTAATATTTTTVPVTVAKVTGSSGLTRPPSTTTRPPVREQDPSHQLVGILTDHHGAAVDRSAAVSYREGALRASDGAA